MKRLGRIACAALLTSVVAGGVVGGAGAAGATTPPNLAGETFFANSSFSGRVYHGSSVFTQVGCNASGSTTLNFTVSGSASGPYPGTFTESGTVVFGPQNTGFDQRAPEVPTGDITQFDSTFTIMSGATTITGTQHVSTYDPGHGECGDYTDVTVIGEVPHPHCDYAVISFGGIPRYAAVINGPDGAFADSGFFAINQGDTNFDCPDGFGSSSSAFGGAVTSSDGLVPLGPASIALSPVAAVNDVGTSHTVTATVDNAAASPVQGTSVLFKVSGTTSTSGSCTTDVNGQCAFTYNGPTVQPGADAITACADANSSGACDAGEPSAEATKAWVLPTATAGQVTGGGQIGDSLRNAKIAFGFTAKSDQNGIKGTCEVIDIAPATNLKIKCTSVTDLVQTANTATFFGDATVNGVATKYRIDVADLAEPGKGFDTFSIQTASGYAASGVLVDGNIQVHG